MSGLAPQRILAVHNFYNLQGGEDQVYRAETELLEERGHVVTRYQEHNSRIASGLVTAVSATWNQRSYLSVRAAIRRHRPDVVHCHNTFPLVSPAVYYAARREGVPVVQKLSNFRLICPGGLLMRGGAVCEECIERRSLGPALRYGCYRASRPATAAVAVMLGSHAALGTWQQMVDVYVAQTEFARGKFIKAGLPAEKVAVKPQMVAPDPGPGTGSGGFALFVGRLSEEKGVHALAAAWRALPDIRLLVAGDGPLDQVAWPASVTKLGKQTREQVLKLLQQAYVSIVPSVCYETGPLTLIESFACGTPVIASNLGSMAERVDDGRTGILFQAGDPQALAAGVRWAFDHPDEVAEMRSLARREYEAKYTAGRNYRLLMDIYDRAMSRKSLRGAA